MTAGGDRAWLAPLGVAFGSLAALKAALYRHGFWRQARLSGPVISVGNLSVGGSGKTPVVARLATLLRDAGLPVSVLSRGYGGSFRGSTLIVSDGQEVQADSRQAGDEPAMLGHALPGVVVAVGPRRDVVGREVERRFGPRVHVLDDGFQHLRLFRDLDLLCVDCLDPSLRPLPAGRLREFPWAARRADVVLLTRAAQAAPRHLAALEQRFAHTHSLRVELQTLGFFDSKGSARPAPRRAFLISGIGRPELFEATVREHAGSIVGHAVFRDHHRFSAREVRAFVKRATDTGADALVTTAKDAVRLATCSGCWPENPALLVLRVAAVIQDEVRLRDRILTLAARAGLAA